MATWYEIIIRGDDRDLVPYLRGFMAAKGKTGIYFGHENGFALRELHDRIKHRGEVQHVFCPDVHRPALKKAIDGARPKFDFEIVEETQVERAYFAFEFDTPSRKIANEVKKFMGDLPKGIKTTDYVPEETVDPDARGAEMYSPAHEYRFQGKGHMEGDLGEIVEARATLHDLDFVECQEIGVHHA
jgi:hypothetical protein